MSVISFEELKKLSEGEEIEIHGFAAGTTITVRLGRPSLLRLTSTGDIPNLLLPAANNLFATGITGAMTEKGQHLPNTYKVMETIAKASLISPTYEDFEKAGVSLTDNQLIDIFQYAQVGVKLVEPFRKNGENTDPDSDGEDLSKKTKRVNPSK